MNHSVRSQFDNDKLEDRLEEYVVGLQKVTCPDVCHMIAYKGHPCLTTRTVTWHLFQIFLDRAFTDRDILFQQFASNPFRTPHAVISTQMPD